MNAKITQVPVVVSDQDRALEFYTRQVGFEKRADVKGPIGGRWLTVAPKGSGVEFALVKGEYVVDPRAEAGVQVTLTTPDCRGEAAKLAARGVKLREPPTDLPFGVLAKLDDPDGNHFALLQPTGGR